MRAADQISPFRPAMSPTHPTQPPRGRRPGPAMRRAVRRAVALCATLALGTACAELAENPPSAFSPTTFYQNDQQVAAALAGVYSSLRATQGDYWAASQVTSDETIVPTRGRDWLDGGQWVDLWQQTYAPASPGTNSLINGTYQAISGGIANANAVLQSLESVDTPAARAGAAEARVLRAWYYFMLQDMFGGVPIITRPGLASQPRAPRDSVVRFIERELLEARTQLPATREAGSWGRVTRYSVDAVLSYLYLNWHVYTGRVNQGGLTPGQPRYAEVIARSDSILNSGQFSLASDFATWRQLFAPNNQQNREALFVVRNVAQDQLGLDFPNRIAHYNHYTGGGWNGFSMASDTYRQLDGADRRRSIVLVGPQSRLDNGGPVLLRDGVTPLSLDTAITSINAAAEDQGARVYKYTIDASRFNQNNGNDFHIFRLSGVMLDRAEALWRLGRTGEAVAILTQLRARAYDPPQPFTGAITEQALLRERLAELMSEGKRRTDQIRLGTFLGPKQFKPGASDGYRILMPIPLNQLQSNPRLTQNCGYPSGVCPS